MMLRSYLAFAAVIVSPAPVLAGQSRDLAVDPDSPPVVVDTKVAQTPEANARQVGERQTRENAARQIGVEPMARINSRIANRIQNRLRNRIDRYYDPRANATAPFAAAIRETRAPGSRH